MAWGGSSLQSTVANIAFAGGTHSTTLAMHLISSESALAFQGNVASLAVSRSSMTSGWGAGEWHDMAWGTGADYPYAPIRIITSPGIAAAYSFRGSAVSLGGSGKQSLPILGKQTVISTITGRATPQTAQGVAVAYSFNGSA